MSDIHRLAPYDWHDIQCQETGCTNTAAHIVQWHVFGQCQITGNEYGNNTNIVCTTCLRRYRREARLDKPSTCPPCGREIHHTLLRSVTLIDQAFWRETVDGTT